jgi:Rad3-related DNA helicase
LSPEKQKLESKVTKSDRRLLNGTADVETELIKKLNSDNGQCEQILSSQSFGDLCIDESHRSDEQVFSYFRTLPPAMIDLELRSLSSIPTLVLFLNSILARIRSKKDFEMVQSILNLTLQINGEILIENEEFREILEEIEKEVRVEKERVEGLVGFSLGALGFIRREAF